MTEQERLMRKISACQFAMWELKIFLDTHPNDCGAMKRLAEYEKQTQDLIAQYEETYGPMNLNEMTANRVAWVQDPWPWEIQAQKEGQS
ncbi:MULTISPECIES: spore coat protein CotJB [Caproicibacterium]|uniref:Spore coat protein CotJB n=1 Tax=Caproicibacterium argilliputei TaxID=3030016 RepID=A0AA97H0V4_9FIRM|nr:spore coat protein CotJB [Caproicibacterium argilliputei]WOC31966.1 spore coat protein CotJB [Caproicibacterium argilliputei]